MYKPLIPLNIQMFADAGTLVSGLGGYANNETGATAAFDQANTLAPQLKTFYDTVALRQVQTKDRITQLAEKETLPAHVGITIEWRKWNDLPDAGVLVEGIIPVGEKMGQTTIVVSVVQYGLYVSLSDRFLTHSVDNGLTAAVERVSNSCVRTREKVARAALLEGGNVAFAHQWNRTTNAYVKEITGRHLLTVGSATACYLDPESVALMQTLLITGNAEKYDDGNFACLIHPHVLHDLKQSQAWKEDHKYTAEGVDKIYQGEAGIYSGFRFVEFDLAPIIKGANLTAAARTLKVASAGVSGAKVIPVKEAIISAEALALAGRKLIISGVVYTVASAAAGSAGDATVTTTENVTALENVVLYPGEGAADGHAVYPTFFMGKDAFAAVESEGMNLKTIIKTPAEIGGPLEQYGTAGAKFETAAVIKYPTQIICLECTSSFYATAAAN